MTVSTGRAIAYDVVVVFVFLLFGSAAHDSAAQGSGHLVALGACFFAGLAAGWGVARAWRTPARVWPTGVIVWLVTVAVGVALRGVLVPDAGFAPTFLAVAAGFLAVTLLGWRALASVPPRR
ncbi:hypothetical protein Xcel_1060 [Xylanimonas cellulosilytica DSM 15894]|uniref:Transmembrane protein n=1 Tax=Xylanimonas cellulosilytica (strain DSM 15894 / JCM 12276 / CECT 5975 / KCTC 9989 / LMG 20990 / NBRC 107835 / XIL07) TaxID=446471 RepID=D1BZD7_XYLCX|nr:DUF3054 domain-containing protein [Xylanimonas cellulosilytica]ACZ30091.1 hypothetical protein Xcel_1060 [Xylanimonas cellulosilytica DSM 15894]